MTLKDELKGFVDDVNLQHEKKVRKFLKKKCFKKAKKGKKEVPISISKVVDGTTIELDKRILEKFCDVNGFKLEKGRHRTLGDVFVIVFCD